MENSIGSFLLFGSIYIKLSSIVKKRLSSLSKTIAIQSQKQIAVVQEGYAGLRDIILNLRQSYYLNLYQQIDWPIRDGAAKSQLFAIFPKYCIESLSLILIAILHFLFQYQIAIR